MKTRKQDMAEWYKIIFGKEPKCIPLYTKTADPPRPVCSSFPMTFPIRLC